MLKKEFKRKDVQRARNLIMGNSGASTNVQVGYNKKQTEYKEGDVWEADVSETYFFDLDGKISSVTQYAKPISSTEDSE